MGNTFYFGAALNKKDIIDIAIGIEYSFCKEDTEKFSQLIDLLVYVGEYEVKEGATVIDTVEKHRIINVDDAVNGNEEKTKVVMTGKEENIEPFFSDELLQNLAAHAQRECVRYGEYYKLTIKEKN